MCENGRGIPPKLQAVYAAGSKQTVANWVSPFISHLKCFILTVKSELVWMCQFFYVLREVARDPFLLRHKQNYRHISLRVATLVQGPQAWCIIIIQKAV